MRSGENWESLLGESCIKIPQMKPLRTVIRENLRRPISDRHVHEIQGAVCTLLGDHPETEIKEESLGKRSR